MNEITDLFTKTFIYMHVCAYIVMNTMTRIKPW